jgi:hypothetical protein
VRLDTRISDVATKIRTDVPSLRSALFISIAAVWVKHNAAGLGLPGLPSSSNTRLKSEWRGKPRSLTKVKRHTAAAISRGPGPKNSPHCCSIAAGDMRVLKISNAAPVLPAFAGGDMVAKLSATARLLRGAAGAVAAFAFVMVLSAPATAAPPPATPFSSNDALLKWINAYRHKPMPDALPVVVRTLSGMQAFKDAESSGAYIGFIAGVLGANPARAENLIAKMLPIDPADHWVLVRAIAYSGLANWKELLATFVDRMPTRRAMIDKYLDGKLPTLEQIDYQPAKPGVFDKIKTSLHFDDRTHDKIPAARQRQRQHR